MSALLTWKTIQVTNIVTSSCIHWNYLSYYPDSFHVYILVITCFQKNFRATKNQETCSKLRPKKVVWCSPPWSWRAGPWKIDGWKVPIPFPERSVSWNFRGVNSLTTNYIYLEPTTIFRGGGSELLGFVGRLHLMGDESFSTPFSRIHFAGLDLPRNFGKVWWCFFGSHRSPGC